MHCATGCPRINQTRITGQHAASTDQNAIQDARMCLIRKTNKAHSNAFVQRCREEPRHSVKLPVQLLVKPCELIPEPTPAPTCTELVHVRQLLRKTLGCVFGQRARIAAHVHTNKPISIQLAGGTCLELPSKGQGSFKHKGMCFHVRIGLRKQLLYPGLWGALLDYFHVDSKGEHSGVNYCVRIIFANRAVENTA